MRCSKIASVALVLALCPAAGPAGDGPVALQTADPSCRDNSGAIYVDCGNGTVTDNRTGLVWLADAGCFNSTVDWHTAMAVVSGLSDLPSSLQANDCGLSDGSSPGEWRLPSLAEWRAMVQDADGDPGQLSCDPPITNDQGIGCWTAPCNAFGFCSFSNVPSAYFWSSTPLQSASYAYLMNFSLPNTLHHTQMWRDDIGLIWPVRGGQ